MTREEAIKEVRAVLENLKSNLSNTAKIAWENSTREAFETLIPEFKESEDERTRKELLEVIRHCYEDGGYALCTDDYKKYSAYLEKQEQKPTPEWMPKFLDELRSKKHYFDWDEHRDIEGHILAIIKWIAPDYFHRKEKEQKPINEGNMHEPTLDEAKKWNEAYEKGYSLGYENGRNEQKPILEVFGFKVGDAVRLKDGDGRKHIIKSFEEVEGVHGPNFYHVEFEDNSASDGIYPGEEYPNGYYTQMEKFEEEQKPEQYSPLCNTVKDKIREYIANHFIADTVVKTDVKSIVKAMEEGVRLGREECRPEEWSEKDKKTLEDLIVFVSGYADKKVVKDWVKFLSSLHPKPKQEWSEEDELQLNAAIDIISNTGLNITANWVKSLPERFNLQPKQEWSEEDETKLRDVIRLIENSGHVKSIREHYKEFLTSLPERFNLRSEPLKELSLEKAIKWFEDTFFFENHSSGRGEDYEISTQDFDSMEEMYDSFRKSVMVESQPIWMPSEEQMEALLNTLHPDDPYYPDLKSLYEDLQKRYGTC